MAEQVGLCKSGMWSTTVGGLHLRDFRDTFANFSGKSTNYTYFMRQEGGKTQEAPSSPPRQLFLAAQDIMARFIIIGVAAFCNAVS
jgi:hypothetical protein